MPKYPHISTPSISSLEGNKPPLAGRNGSLGHLALLTDIEQVKELLVALEQKFITLANTGSYEEFKLAGDKCLTVKKSGKNTYVIQLAKTFVEKTDIDKMISDLNDTIKKGDAQALKAISIKGSETIKIKKVNDTSFEIDLAKSYVESDAFKRAVESINSKIDSIAKKFVDKDRYDKWSDSVEDKLEKLQQDRVSKGDIKLFATSSDMNKIETTLSKRVKRVEELSDPKNSISFCFDDFITKCKSDKEGEDIFDGSRLGIKKYNDATVIEYKEYGANKNSACVASMSICTTSDQSGITLGFIGENSGIYFNIVNGSVEGVCRNEAGHASTKQFDIDPNKWYIYKIEIVDGSAKFMIWDESINKVVYNRLQSLNMPTAHGQFNIIGHGFMADWFYYKGERKAKIPENML
jgi:hypothetical protein